MGTSSKHPRLCNFEAAALFVGTIWAMLTEPGSVSSSLLDVEEEVENEVELTWSVIVTDVFVVLGMLWCM